MRDLVYTASKEAWFYNKYYVNGSNSRFWTFQTALSILCQQKHGNGESVIPTIVETGSQRQKDDLGAGMSTSIFAEYISRYNGELHVVDNNPYHLNIAQDCVSEWKDKLQNKIAFYCLDSVEFLENWMSDIDLLYLDSWDYPIFEMAKYYDSDFNVAVEKMKEVPEMELRRQFKALIDPCQNHCLREFQAAEKNLHSRSILLVDDNNLPGGGKPGTLKPYLEEKGWTCLMDFQQSLWIRNL